MKTCANCNLVLGNSEIRVSNESFNNLQLCHPCIRKRAIFGIPTNPASIAKWVGMRALKAIKGGKCPACAGNGTLGPAECFACDGTGTFDSVKAKTGDAVDENMPKIQQLMQQAQAKAQEVMGQAGIGQVAPAAPAQDADPGFYDDLEEPLIF